MASLAPLQFRAHPTNPVSDWNAGAGSFSAVEWSVLALARTDGLSSLRPAGGIGERIGAWLGLSRSPRLADERLEALRRMAVLAWHRGYLVADEDVREFLAAGFTCDQYETLQARVGQERTRKRERPH